MQGLSVQFSGAFDLLDRLNTVEIVDNYPLYLTNFTMLTAFIQYECLNHIESMMYE